MRNEDRRKPGSLRKRESMKKKRHTKWKWIAVMRTRCRSEK